MVVTNNSSELSFFRINVILVGLGLGLELGYRLGVRNAFMVRVRVRFRGENSKA